MGTPTTAQGRDYAIGAKKGAAWGTALAATNGLVLPIGGLKGFDAGAVEYAPRQDHDQGPIPKGGDFGPYKAADFSIECDMLHDPGPLGTLIALLFGTAGTPATGGTTSKVHTFQWKTNTVGLFATVATEMPNIIHECPSAKPTGWSLAIGDHGKIKSTLKLRGNKIVVAAVNIATIMDALTYVDRSNRLKFSGMTFKMNAAAAEVDVAGTTALVINSIGVDYERPLDSVLCAGGDAIVEPIENGFSKITIKLGFPRMTSAEAAYLATFLAGTPQKALITFTGNLIETDHYYCLKLFFPRLIMTDPKNVMDQIIHSELTLQAEEAAANPTGMAYTACYATMENLATTDYLA